MEQSIQRSKKGESELPTKLTIESLQTWERAYMFKNCIVDHNITDKNGVKLDFRNEMALHILRPDIGFEIERLIDELHAEDEIPENFPTALTSSSEHQEQEQPMHLVTDSPTT